MSITIKMPFRGSSGDGEAELTSENAQVVQSLHGKHYEDCLAGRVFSQIPTPLGLAIPIYTATALAGAMPIWNPVGSGVNVELINIASGYVSGTSAYGSVVLMARTNIGSVLATGAEITAFAETTPVNGLLGSGVTSKVRSSNAGTVTVTAGVAAEAVRSLFTMNLEAATGTAHALTQVRVDFEGSVIVPPGTLIWVAGRVASVALFATSITWKEIDL